MKDDADRLKELEQTLYERTEPEPRKRFLFRDRQGADVARDWKHDGTTWPIDPQNVRNFGRSFASKFLMFAVVFFLGALAVAGFIVFRGGNVISSRNVTVKVTGPVSVDGGGVLPMQIDVTNHNQVILESAQLIVEFPDGAHDIEDPTKPIARSRFDLGSMAPGETLSEDISVVLFGEEGSQKDITITVEYRVEGSSATFSKGQVFSVQIGAAPLTLLTDFPDEVNSGQDIPMTIELISNATEVLQDVVFSIDYPFGVTFIEATPDPSSGNNIWRLGDIEPQERVTLNVRTRVMGEDNEERTLRFSAGILNPDAPVDEIGATLLSASRSFTISRSFVDVSLEVNGSDDDVYIAEAGDTIRGDISWQNNLETRIEDVSISLELVGEALDESSITSTNGFYQSSNNTLVWSSEQVPSLASVAPKSSGQFSFEFSLKDADDIEEGEIALTVRIAAESEDTEGVLDGGDEQVIKVASAVSLESEAFYYSGPFSNSGPLPPEADTETTYTIIWSIRNPGNDLESVRVSAPLPSYVSWAGLVSPTSQNVTYNNGSREVIWSIERISAGVGYTKAPQEVAFQVKLLPSTAQVGSSPELVGDAVLSARDTFINKTVGDRAGAVSTLLDADPEAGPADGRVVP